MYYYNVNLFLICAIKDITMRNYILFVFIIANTLHMNNLWSCPCEFAPDDERPFFEQYEIENNSAHAQKKDK